MPRSERGYSALADDPLILKNQIVHVTVENTVFHCLASSLILFSFYADAGEKLYVEEQLC